MPELTRAYGKNAEGTTMKNLLEIPSQNNYGGDTLDGVINQDTH
jgi:hypothetical protein